MNPGYFLFEANLAAKRDDFSANAFDHFDQFKGTDMRFANHQDLGGCTRGDKFFQYLSAKVTPVSDLAIELAI